MTPLKNSSGKQGALFSFTERFVLSFPFLGNRKKRPFYKKEGNFFRISLLIILNLNQFLDLRDVDLFGFQKCVEDWSQISGISPSSMSRSSYCSRIPSAAVISPFLPRIVCLCRHFFVSLVLHGET